MGKFNANIADFFVDEVDTDRLIQAFSQLRVPRHLFKFLYKLLSERCIKHMDEKPSFKISIQLFESTLAVYLSNLDSFDHHGGGVI